MRRRYQKRWEPIARNQRNLRIMADRKEVWRRKPRLDIWAVSPD